MEIRLANEGDIPRIMELLSEVLEVHAAGRADIFISGRTKYSERELGDILKNEKTPIYVAVDGDVLGYVFCIYKETKDSSVLRDRRELYIDDLCVDSRLRGQGIGKELLRYAENVAATAGCDAVTLNVWSLNAGAMRFYEKCGYTPLKVVMERSVK